VRILLDTVTFLWALTDAPDLSDDARELFVDPENEVYLSSVSTWEIAIKHSRGKLPLPEPPVRFVPAQRKQHSIDSLPLDEEATLYLSRLPVLHKDPFDRMLVCQAIVHQLVILTPDELINQYPVRTAW
jgi:PIN domain nuclease of toxin-antitoxin system